MKIIKFAVSIGLLLSLLQLTEGVDRSKFRTCKDTGFCRRFRDLSSGPVFDDHVSDFKCLQIYTSHPSWPNFRPRQFNSIVYLIKLYLFSWSFPLYISLCGLLLLF